MKKLRILIPLICFPAILLMSGMAIPATPARAAGPAGISTPVPTPNPPPATPPVGGGTGTASTVISQIFHRLTFPASTISRALAGIFDKAADKEMRAMNEEVARWTAAIGDILQAPQEGDYSKAAQSSLPLAAALAPALFLLRLALYHWGRLLGEEDGGLRVVGDWVTAAVLAIACGPLLDLVVRLGWWMVGRVIGETGTLAVKFVEATTVTSILLGLATQSFIGSLLNIGISIGALLAIGGMLFAFGSANAALFILAVLGPPLAIASVLPQAAWLRSLWMKAVLVIALLPIVAGGVFKAGMAASTWLGQQGILSAILRVVWLWGATGLLLSLAGILGRMTISTTADALGGMVKAAQQIVSMGMLAASGVGAAGAGAAGAAGIAGTGASGATGGLSGAQAASSHLQSAQHWNQQAGSLSAMGLHAPAAYARSLAHGHELAARQAELGERMQRFQGAPPTPAAEDFGFSPSVNASIRSSFHGSPQEFQQGFQAMSADIVRHGLDPNVLAAQYPRETAQMARAWLDHPQDITGARDPLLRASELGNAPRIQEMLTFLPNRLDRNEESS